MKKKIIIGCIGVLFVALIFKRVASSWTGDDSNDHGHEHHHEHHHDEEDGEEEHLHLSREVAGTHGVLFEKASSGNLRQELVLRAKVAIDPDRFAHVLPKISGVAKTVYKKLGDPVKKGEVLAVLESREMADAKGAYLAALSRLKLKEIAFKREERLFEKKVISEEEYLSTKFSLDEAKINFQLEKQKLNALGLKESELASLDSEDAKEFRFHLIRSPIDGVVVARHMTQGEFIEERSEVFALADLSSLIVEAGVYSKDVHHIKKGAPFRIEPKDSYKGGTGNVIYLSPLIDEESITARLIGRIDNRDGSLRPGSVLEIHVLVAEDPVNLMVPKSALQTVDGRSVLFIPEGDVFHVREVKVGRSDTNSYELLSGLDAGEEYAAGNTFLLKADLGKESVEHEH